MRHVLFATACALTLLFAAIAGHCEALLTHARILQIAWAIGFVGYALFLHVLVSGQGERFSLRHIRALVIVMVLARAIIFTGPTSDDMARYLWEGRIQSHGYNPYAIPPNDERLIPLRDATWTEINHPELTAIYPPFSQFVFALLGVLAATPLMAKCVVIGFDLAAIAVLMRWLRAIGRDPAWVGVYGLCPLVLSGIAMEGHHDSFMIFWMALAGLCVHHHRWRSATVCIGLAVLSKMTAVVLLIWLAFRHKRVLPLAVAVIIAGYLPYIAAGEGLVRSLWIFSGGDYFNTPFAEWIIPYAPNHLVRVAFVVIGFLYVLVAAQRHTEFAPFALRAFAAMILLMPVVHYWYVTWVMVFLVIEFRVAWILLSGTMLFYLNTWHHEFTQGEWRLTTASRMLIWLPFIAIWLIEALMRRRHLRRSNEV